MRESLTLHTDHYSKPVGKMYRMLLSIRRMDGEGLKETWPSDLNFPLILVLLVAFLIAVASVGLAWQIQAP